MFPTLGHLINYLFGTNITFPIPTYGTMLASALVMGYLVMRLELKRKEKIGLLSAKTKKVLKGKASPIWEYFLAGLIGLVIGYKFIGIFVDYSIFSENPGDYFLSAKGNLIGGIFGSVLMIYFQYKSDKKQLLPKPVWVEEIVHPYQLSGIILIYAAIAGIIGSKIFHQLENLDEFLVDPIGSIFNTGGLTFYGGLIFGTAAVIWFCKKNNIKLVHMMDVAAPAILLSYAIGRIGCQLSGDGCWGVVNLAFSSTDVAHGVFLAKPAWLGFLPDWLFAFNYPHNVLNEGLFLEECHGKYCKVLGEPVFPTPIYETSINLIYFFVLWSIRKKIMLPGILFAWMLIMNGFARFWIEKIRINTKYHWGSFQITQAEIISVILVICGIVLLIFLRRNYLKKKPKNAN